MRKRATRLNKRINQRKQKFKALLMLSSSTRLVKPQLLQKLTIFMLSCVKLRVQILLKFTNSQLVILAMFQNGAQTKMRSSALKNYSNQSISKQKKIKVKIRQTGKKCQSLPFTLVNRVVTLQFIAKPSTQLANQPVTRP